MSALNATRVPTVPFGQYQISRLIMGDNPIYGYSHFNQLLSGHQKRSQYIRPGYRDPAPCRRSGYKRLAKFPYRTIGR